MRRFLYSILLLLLPVSIWGQDVTLLGRVRDAETGEPLPYASIYVGKGRGSLTNTDGEFYLSVSAQDILTFSYIGYEKLRMKASEVPKEVRLKPFEQVLQEVVVMPVSELDIVRQVIRNLKKDFSTHKKDRLGYFMRTLLKNKDDSYLMESIMSWSSAVNLRDDELYSGMYGKNAEGDESNIHLKFTNITRVAEIGPSAFVTAYWRQSIRPFNSVSMTKKYYNVEVQTLFGSEGVKLYRITFRKKGNLSEKQEQRRILTGTAFVDAKTMRLLNYEGEVENAFQSVNFRRLPTTIKFHLNYDYNRGYAAVNNIVVQGGNDEMKYRLLLFDIQDDSLALSRGYVGENARIYAEYDSTLWNKYNIVKRTSEEEIIAFGKRQSEGFEE